MKHIGLQSVIIDCYVKRVYYNKYFFIRLVAKLAF